MTHQSLKCHKAAILLGGHSSRMGGQPEVSAEGWKRPILSEKADQGIGKSR